MEHHLPEIDSDGKVSDFRHVEIFVEERKGGTNNCPGGDSFCAITQLKIFFYGTGASQDSKGGAIATRAIELHSSGSGQLPCGHSQ